VSSPVAADARPGRAQRWRVPLMAIGVIAAGAIAAWLWLSGGRYVQTDDAYTQAARATISCNLSGRVIAVEVHDNQRVHRGDVLFRLDDRAWRIAVEAARARLGAARLQIGAAKASYQAQKVEVGAAQDTLAFQESELARQQRLLGPGISSQAQFDQARHSRDAARQRVDSARQQAASALALLDNNPGIDPERHPSVLEARAELARAELNLSYATVLAPDDGIVTQVERLQAGDYVTAASPLFALISTRDVWVEANFKEDQLTRMRPGQPATVRLDTFPGRVLKAHVGSLAPGTGSQFSALPAENSTGNWVKVVQRVPVRIELEPGQFDSPAAPGAPGNQAPAPAELAVQTGLSAVVEVDTGGRSEPAPAPRAGT
jgi:membrane fusion protein, multidrug efflux system